MDGDNETDISGAYEISYQPVTLDAGKSLKVRVSFFDDESGSESRSSAEIPVAAPRVASIEFRTPAQMRTNANSLTWRVTFSEDMANVDEADFRVTGTNAALTVTEVVFGDRRL